VTYRRHLSVDVETFSRTDLKKHGVHRYAADPEFTIILFQYRYHDEPQNVVHVVQLVNGESIPDEVLADLVDPTVAKHAWNAPFERTVLAVFLMADMPAEQWFCTMVHAAMLGFPLDLDRCGKVLKLRNKKIAAAFSAMRFFCLPCKPTKTNGERTRNFPRHDPDKWALFLKYGENDVLAEEEIYQRLLKVRIADAEKERAAWILDQRTNDHGVRVDVAMAANAVELDKQFKKRCFDEAVRVTGLDNPNSVAQLKGWLKQADDINVTSLNKKIVPQILKNTDNEAVKRAMELRQELSKTSVQKYQAAVNRASADEFLRALVQFYGANRTGRWAGRGVQVHNLPSNVIADLVLARELLRAGAFDTLEILFGSPSYTLSQLLRTLFLPDNPDEVLFAVDFKAIEARKLAWGAGEQWRLEVFKTHGQIYEASASAMFYVPWEEFQSFIDRGKKHPLRQKGKIAELALGYQGGEGALITMGALDMGLKLEELDPIKVAWRLANQAIAGQSYKGEKPGFWEKMDTAAIQCVATGRPQEVEGVYGTRFYIEHGIMFMRLPSGRCLAYPQPKLTIGKFGNDCVSYTGLDDANRWVRIDSYGGKWVENWCQASSRDVLRDKILRIDAMPAYTDRLRFTVHDEGVWSVPRKGYRIEDLEEVFAEPLDWAPGLPLAGDGSVLEFYRKDDS
jgi:DNA polymerase